MVKHTGKTRNIDDLLVKARNRIYRIGIELEGGWTKLPKETKLTHDGSVRFSGLSGGETIGRDRDGRGVVLHQDPGGPAYVGELPSPPLEMDKWKPWVRQFYPSHVNDTCGMHVHMSFRSALTYQRLMTPDYQETMLDYLLKWAKTAKFPDQHHIWERVRGNNRFCQRSFMAEEQAQRKEKSHEQHGHGHRYTAINYAYGQHSTVECRVLPMMETAEQALIAIDEVLRITNAFLVTDSKNGRQALVAASLIDDDYHREELIECV